MRCSVWVVVISVESVVDQHSAAIDCVGLHEPVDVGRLGDKKMAATSADRSSVTADALARLLLGLATYALTSTKCGASFLSLVPRALFSI